MSDRKYSEARRCIFLQYLPIIRRYAFLIHYLEHHLRRSLGIYIDLPLLILHYHTHPLQIRLEIESLKDKPRSARPLK
jgi:hypothetical protein